MQVEKLELLDTMFESKKQYLIPVYQRNYDWKKDNCNTLFYDAIMAYKEEKSHFLGSIVRVLQGEENNIRKYLIIDGQQRMTSIYLLLKALYDSNPKESEKEELEDYLFNKKFNNVLAKDNKLKLKLKPIETDNIQFTSLMDDKFEDIDKTSNIFINYEHFKTLIKKHISQDITIKNILTGIKKLNIVMITLKVPEDDPQVVFERINSTGEDLSLADLIRNYILMTNEEMDELYKEYWLPIERRISKDRLVDFFQTYLIYKLPDNSKDQYQSFKKYVSKNGITHLELLQEMNRLSKYYSAFVNVKHSNVYSKKVNNLLEGFRNLKQTTIYSFLFYIFTDFENGIISDDDLYEVLLFFLNYTIRRAVTGVPTNSLRGLYKGLYKRIFVDEQSKQNYLRSIYTFMAELQSKDAVPNDTIFKDRLLTEDIYKNRDACRFILKILENGINQLKESVVVDKNITIEHIMPQNRENVDWRNEIGSDFYYVWDKYIHTLGNLTLTGYNSELSDKTFVEKRELIKNHSKFVNLNQDIIDKGHWNEDTIKARAERLSSKLLKELKLPDELRKEKKESEIKRYSLDEGIDYSHLKLKSFILLGENREIKSGSEMLVGVCSILYEVDTDLFSNLLNDEKDKKHPLLTLDSNLQRKGKEIENTGIYVETNKSLNEIVQTIKKLLDIYSLEYDDFIFYA